MRDDFIVLLVVAALLVLIITVFVRTSTRLRKGGGSLATTVLGATAELLTKDRQKAADTIVNFNAGRKIEEQQTGEPAQK